MNRRFSMLICACTTSLLVACGGGSDGGDRANDGNSPTPPADVTDRYEGSWLTACQQDYDAGENPAFPDGKSQISGLVLRKLSPTTMSFGLTTNEYETPDCTGTRTAAFFSRGDVVFDGQKSANRRTTDRAEFRTTTGTAGTVRDILWTDGNVLYRGLSGTEGADGFPSELYLNRPWSRI
jgi:hypothetical protein